MTPVERARVAVIKETGAYRTDGGMWMREGGRVADGYFDDIVRAVLTAIREPSEAMVKAAGFTPGVREIDKMVEIARSLGQSISRQALIGGSPIERAYTAMIDAMLEEG